MIQWRFDQGRLQYFEIAEIKKIAVALASIDNASKPAGEDSDTIRVALAAQTTLPFLPEDYFVWRNYGRVFGCMMLAADVGGKILATDLCKKIASAPDDLDSDEYLAHFTRTFYYPSPIFEGYIPTGAQVFPVAALLKFLISEKIVRGKSYVTLDEIASYLIGNEVTGIEPLATFIEIKKSTYSIDENHLRQVRELVKFVSQFSFLKWENPKLYIDINNKEELLSIADRIQPIPKIRKIDSAEEIMQLGGGYTESGLGELTQRNASTLDEEFTEGQKIRVTHLRTERSGKLKGLFFEKIKNPEICDMCKEDTSQKYPWVPHVIELHHILPLSSPVRVEHGTTSVKDLVGLCPSCHRATHQYYSTWLKANGRKDFLNREQAVQVYEEAKSKLVKQ